MDRREAIKNFIFVSGAALVLPSCMRQEGKASIELNNFAISAKQEDLLGEITETILPRTDTPGAKELLLHLFVLKMVDDCHDKPEQQDFVKGLSGMDDFAHQRLGQSFTSASLQKRTALLASVESDANVPEAVKSFYKITKRRTIQGYMNSKYVMTNLVKYELVPGRYNGYMPV